MKKIFLCTVAALALLCLQLGCGSTPQAKAVQAAGVQVATVDSAMGAWSEWVNAGKATQAQVDAVRDLYMKYYVAAKAEQTALEAYVSAKTDANKSNWEAARDAWKASESDLISLIQTFKK